MSYKRELQPDPLTYYEGQGLKLASRGKWRTTECRFHGGSDSMRINVGTGAFVCMACGVKGGDVLAHHMQAHGLEFVEAAKSLGCWADDGTQHVPAKPAPLPPRAALQVVGFEATLAAVAAANVARGVALSDVDLARLLTAANRIARIVESYA